MPYENAEPLMIRWHSETDIRDNEQVLKEILNLIKNNEVKTVVMIDKIMGCPHEEGIDYPEDESCQECPYWLNQDRWSDHNIH